MQKISVVIVCKNEEDSIGRCLESLHGLTDDIVVLDNGSIDATKEIVRKAGVRLEEDSWEGFGKTRRKAALLAKYDWVLSLDADEAIDEDLKNNLLSLALDNEKEVFEMRFKNFLGNKYLRFGEWGSDKHVRLFNRAKVNWDEAVVHEKLLLTDDIKKTKLKGCILHFTMKDVAEFSTKMVQYALLSASKYAGLGKRSSWLKIYMAPVFSFLKYYIFKLGFLDGWAGLVCARMTSYYTFVKYARLRELQNIEQKNKEQGSKK